MNTIYKLKNTVKHYPWGSAEWLPEMLGQKADGRPWAELWMGTHAGGPSAALTGDGEQPLEAVAGALPYLFKVLAAGRPLSIQAHPNREQAREGFARENAAGVPLDVPERNYKDANHKPEIICALSAMDAMCGFRRPEQIAALLDGFLAGAPPELVHGMEGLRRTLDGAGTGAEKLHAFLETLFALPQQTRAAVGERVKTRAGATGDDSGGELGRALTFMRRFAGLYPDDAALISPLYLNLIHLRPGEAMYLEAGVMHAYIGGLGMELMAASDNVLRGGLTAKHVDVQELLRVLRFEPAAPKIQRPAGNPWTYESGGEFALTVIQGGKGERRRAAGPAIVFAADGDCRLGGCLLARGEAAYVPAGECSLEGDFVCYIATAAAGAV